MPLKKSAGKKAENRERGVRAKARAIGIKKFGASKVKGKEIHHKNGNNKDNRPSNLALKTKSAHAKLHGRGHGKRGTKNIGRKK